MGERSGRFRLGRRRSSSEPEPEPEPGAHAHAHAADVPCAPCAQQAQLRQFSLNEAETIDDDTVPWLVPGIEDAITGGEVVLFDVDQATSTLLNSSAALVWASIDGEATIGQIVDDLVAETGADRTTIHDDVHATVARLITGGIARGIPQPDDDEPAVPEADDAEPSPTDLRAARRADRVGRILDRHDWTFVDQRRCAGAPVTIRTDSEELAALLRPALALLPASDGAPGTTLSITDRGDGAMRRFRILRDRQLNAYARNPSDAFDTIFTTLNDIAVNETPDRLVLHAGAAERDGSVVVVAGASGRGKSTFTAGLVQRGFGYLTDEVVAVDPETLEVLPYPKPFDLSRASSELLGLEPARDDGIKGKVPVDQVGAVAADGGTVRLLVLLDDPDAPAPRDPSAGEQLVELLTNTFASTFASGPPDALGALATLAGSVSILHLTQPAIAEAFDAVDSQLRSIDLAPT